MTGRVENLQAVVPVTLRLLSGGSVSIEFVIDTGFAGDLTLPSQAVAALQLPYLFDTRANLADNSSVEIPVHGAVVVIGNQERPVNILATGWRPLLGTGLLQDKELLIQFQEGGLVSIDAL